jgi:hypothetical protein
MTFASRPLLHLRGIIAAKSGAVATGALELEFASPTNSRTHSACTRSSLISHRTSTLVSKLGTNRAVPQVNRKR